MSYLRRHFVAANNGVNYSFLVSFIHRNEADGRLEFYEGAEIVSSNASTELITTATDHGLAVGDPIMIADHRGAAPDYNETAAFVATVPSSTTLTVAGWNFTTAGAGGLIGKRMRDFFVLADVTAIAIAGEPQEPRVS